MEGMMLELGRLRHANVPFRLLTKGVPVNAILRFVLMGPSTFEISEVWVFNSV